MIRVLIFFFSTSVACLLVGMALNGSPNPLTILSIAHIMIVPGMVVALAAIIYSFLKGNILWDHGERKFHPYIDVALKSALVNAAALIVLTGVPFMKGAPVVAIIFFAAFA